MKNLAAFEIRQFHPLLIRLARRIRVPGKPDISAQWHPGHFPACPAFVGPAENFAPEADRKDVSLDPAPAANKVMAQFMEKNQWPDRNQEGQDGPDKAGSLGHATTLSIRADATRRASESIARTSANEIGSAGT